MMLKDHYGNFARRQETLGPTVGTSTPMISIGLPAFARGSVQELPATCAKNPEVDS